MSLIDLEIDDNAYSRATVVFPRSVSLKEAERLMDYVSANLPGEATMDCRYGVRFGTRFGELKDEETERQDLLGVSLTGTITRKGGDFAFDSFRCSNSDNDLRTLAGLTFNVIPGYTLREHRQEVLKLWGDVRAVVGRYFIQRDSE